MKRIACIIILLTTFGHNWVEAQQLPQHSQYFLNDYIYNPAVAGTRDAFEAKLNQRYQWSGIVDAPRTYTLSVQGPMKSRKVGVGGYVFSDITGPTRRSGFYGSVSYILQLSDKAKLSFALSAGLLQYAVDGSKINLENTADVALSNALQSTVVPDAGIGLLLYGEKFYAGFAAPQIAETKLNFFKEGDNGSSTLARHMMAMGGYKIKTSGDFQYEPTFLIKYVDPVPLQLELATKITYQNALWLGLSYRLEDAAAVMLGYDYLQNLSFSYSYDIITSGLKKYSTGSHEIMVGIRFMRRLPKK